MPESISTSKPFRPTSKTITHLTAIGAVVMILLASNKTTWAAPGEVVNPASQKDKTQQPEEDDKSSTPWTEYGEFNEDDDEATDTNFFQHGRFFGVSLGVGYQGVTGNRGILWRGGFPLVDIKVHYWFDFNLGLDINFNTTRHYFDSQSETGNDHKEIQFSKLLMTVKYYFDTKNVSSAISFSNPYLLGSIGTYQKTEASTINTTAASSADSVIGFAGGGGLEFPLKHRKAYLQIEGRLHWARFNDTSLTVFKDKMGIPDLNGMFYSMTAGVLFTW